MKKQIFSISSKEKTRLADRAKVLASLSHNPEARQRASQAFAQQDQMRLRACRSAIGKGVIPILMPERVIEYLPSTGEFRWAIHPDPARIGTSPLNVSKDGTRYISRSDKKGTVSAARLAHEAVHGPIPEHHGVYCVNGDQGDLSILNLRLYEIKNVKRELDAMLQEPVEIPDELRAKLRANRLAREARGE